MFTNPAEAAMATLEVRDLTKRYGDTLAVDELSFRAEPGTVTAFLGANGAGKTTTLRALLGLVEPTSGSATIDGHRYAELPRPREVVGALLEASGVHPGRQRLGLATALLGDPAALVLDEPANGLDPQGIHWLRGLLRGLADEGRTVLLSSHLLAEVAQLADRLVIIDRGRLVREGAVAELAPAGTPLEDVFLALTTPTAAGA